MKYGRELLGLALLAGVFCLPLLRPRVSTEDWSGGGAAYAPFDLFANQGTFLAQRPKRIFRIETTAPGSEAVVDQKFLTQLKVPVAKVQSDLARWQQTGSVRVSFDYFPPMIGAEPPAWFPATTRENFLASITLPNGLSVILFRSPTDSQHVFLFY